MKIELNPSRMTVAELNDCITELTAQRDRIMEEGRSKVEHKLHDAVIEMMGTIWDYTDDRGPFDVVLTIKPTHGREHRIHMDMASIEEWGLEVSYRPEQ